VYLLIIVYLHLQGLLSSRAAGGMGAPPIDTSTPGYGSTQAHRNGKALTGLPGIAHSLNSP
jgi:hypothetical protein